VHLGPIHQAIKIADLEYYQNVTRKDGFYTGDSSYSIAWLALGNRSGADEQFDRAFLYMDGLPGAAPTSKFIVQATQYNPVSECALKSLLVLTSWSGRECDAGSEHLFLLAMCLPSFFFAGTCFTLALACFIPSCLQLLHVPCRFATHHRTLSPCPFVPSPPPHPPPPTHTHTQFNVWKEKAQSGGHINFLTGAGGFLVGLAHSSSCIVVAVY
jgi:hypothetical protein